jgi:hypothetical protein
MAVLSDEKLPKWLIEPFGQAIFTDQWSFLSTAVNSVLSPMIDCSDHRAIIAAAMPATARRQSAANTIDLSTERLTLLP